MSRRWVVIILIVLTGLFLIYGQASAQTPEPTPTPTPSYMQVVAMSTGSDLLITKSVSYGDVAIVIALLLLLAVQLLTAMVFIPKIWVKK